MGVKTQATGYVDLPEPSGALPDATPAMTGGTRPGSPWSPGPAPFPSLDFSCSYGGGGTHPTLHPSEPFTVE